MVSGVNTFGVHKMDENLHSVTFGVGRGQRAAGRGWLMSPGVPKYTADRTVNPPLTPTASSTPITQSGLGPSQAVSVDFYGDMIANLAKQIGENISASLNTMRQPSTAQPQSPTTSQSSNDAGLSQLKVVVQSDTKAPPFFRGDRADVFSVHEWEDMMRCYLNRVKCDTHAEMFDLIMSRLTGKARDVVKVSLRSHPEMSAADKPTAVFDILKGNFSELSYSNLPMKDFYGTIPRAGESAMDYWIRLNKSIDAADECLRRRGKSVEDPSAEVVLMFINHCPDPRLAMSFQLKAPEQWTAAEVQGRLDAHMRNMRNTAAQSQYTVGLSANNQSPVAASFHPFDLDRSQAAFVARQPKPPSSSLPVSSLACSQPQSDNVMVIPREAASLSLPPSAISDPAHAAVDSLGTDPGVQQVVAMFDKVLSLCNASIAANQRPVSCQPGSHQPAHRQNGRSRNPQTSEPFACKVCGSRDHSTHAHCRFYRLCLNCFSPGHIRNQCLQASLSPAMPPPSSSNANLN